MAIKNMCNYKQIFDVSYEDKIKLGEIYTPFSLIEDMLNMLSPDVFKDKTAKWLDPGAGSGYFSMMLYWKLNNGLAQLIPNNDDRHEYIIKNMIYMVEIKPTNIQKLIEMFGKNANIFEGDFLDQHHITALQTTQFDYIIGNPPYNMNGIKKVPTNNIKNKKDDGKTVWFSFIKRAISLLKQTGHLVFIVPSIWMRPDKAKIYDYLTHYKIEKLKCLTNTETNKYFNGNAQTPTCYFVLSPHKPESLTNIYYISLYDKDATSYIQYNFTIGEPIPVFGAEIIMKLKSFIKTANGHLRCYKTNMPRAGTSFTTAQDEQHPYKNITTCILNCASPQLIINYSDKTQVLYGKKKLILPHKMYGFPYLDDVGQYGISNRDNYVITNVDYSLLELIKWRDFLSTKTALYIFEAARYRMKCLEKQAFEFIPDITRLPMFPDIINDATIATYFGFNEMNICAIERLHKKKYTFTYN